MILCLKIKKILERKHCPLCKNKLSSNLGSKIVCFNCETEWIFNAQTGVIEYALFYGNRKNKSKKQS